MYSWIIRQSLWNRALQPHAHWPSLHENLVARMLNAQIRRTLHGILTTHTTLFSIYMNACTQPNRMQTTHAHTHALTASEATSGPGTPPQTASWSDCFPDPCAGTGRVRVVTEQCHARAPFTCAHTHTRPELHTIEVHYGRTCAIPSYASCLECSTLKVWSRRVNSYMRAHPCNKLEKKEAGTCKIDRHTWREMNSQISFAWRRVAWAAIAPKCAPIHIEPASPARNLRNKWHKIVFWPKFWVEHWRPRL